MPGRSAGAPTLCSRDRAAERATPDIPCISKGYPAWAGQREGDLDHRSGGRLEGRTTGLELGDQVRVLECDADVVKALHEAPAHIVVDLERGRESRNPRPVGIPERVVHSAGAKYSGK